MVVNERSGPARRARAATHAIAQPAKVTGSPIGSTRRPWKLEPAAVITQAISAAAAGAGSITSRARAAAASSGVSVEILRCANARNRHENTKLRTSYFVLQTSTRVEMRNEL